MSRLFAGGASTDSIALGSFAPSTQRTISAWIWMTSVDSNQRRIWNYASNDETSVIDRMWALSTPDRLILQAGFDGSVAQIEYPTLSVGAWHHVFVSYDGLIGSTPVVLYDGLSQTGTLTNAPSGNLIMTTQPFQIGNRGDGIRCWNGRLAEVVRWDVALTIAEGVALAHGANPWKLRRANQVLACPLWGTHNPELDLSPNRRTCTVTGTTRETHPPVVGWWPLRRGTLAQYDAPAAPGPGAETIVAGRQFVIG